MTAAPATVIIPTLETERLRLLPPDLECFNAYESFYTDAQASHRYGGPLTSEQAWARLKADLGSWHLLGFGVWAIQLKSTGAICGTCGFWQGRGWPRELTWWLAPGARGQGIALEASRAALRHAFHGFHWPDVETYMNDENEPARRLVERLGGRRTRRAEFPDGLSRDIYVVGNTE